MKFVELFAGIGLVRLGMEAAGWECVYANDIDHKKEETYRMNFSGDDFHLEDIWNVKTSDLPHSFDMITASFPCVDLSLAGNRMGLKAERSGTFWAFIEILNQLKIENRLPKVLMIENVVGFLTSHKGQDFYNAIKSLNEIGYDTDAFILDANHFTPQSRQRLFVIGIHQSVSKLHMTTNGKGSIDNWSEMLSNDSTLRPQKLAGFILKTPELKWGLLDIPSPPPIVKGLEKIIEDISHDSDWWWNTEKVQKLLGQMSPRHLQIATEYQENHQEWSYGTIYRRMRNGSSRAELRTDGIAGCLRTPRGGSSKQILLKAGYGDIRVRWLTPREYGRLQGAPDQFKNPENNTQAYFGYGDAVCVPAITWLTEHIINPCMVSAEEREKQFAEAA